ncbi:hypothetical protein PtA15_14A107 [Puccinia triticina]|uniref:Zn(2)-C6 fungal-type domain-containing protein n=1 Tax=Puccinia triticina TaxID=208348 RepID=A0ABY7D1W3_9BASI|nr:uncharacterized protein PtA15_14A107 [Puccinia triticina]WAQ91225.1 hypothetical protein PtA15_14A107 [Puccinia triticina]WAR62026.1 hypothetical protein PtB15_14B120 [Puccinia triticina]
MDEWIKVRKWAYPCPPCRRAKVPCGETLACPKRTDPAQPKCNSCRSRKVHYGLDKIIQLVPAQDWFSGYCRAKYSKGLTEEIPQGWDGACGPESVINMRKLRLKFKNKIQQSTSRKSLHVQLEPTCAKSPNTLLGQPTQADRASNHPETDMPLPGCSKDDLAKHLVIPTLQGTASSHPAAPSQPDSTRPPPRQPDSYHPPPSRPDSIHPLPSLSDSSHRASINQATKPIPHPGDQAQFAKNLDKTIVHPNTVVKEAKSSGGSRKRFRADEEDMERIKEEFAEPPMISDVVKGKRRKLIIEDELSSEEEGNDDEIIEDVLKRAENNPEELCEGFPRRGVPEEEEREAKEEGKIDENALELDKTISSNISEKGAVNDVDDIDDRVDYVEREVEEVEADVRKAKKNFELAWSSDGEEETDLNGTVKDELKLKIFEMGAETVKTVAALMKMVPKGLKEEARKAKEELRKEFEKKRQEAENIIDTKL